MTRRKNRNSQRAARRRKNPIKETIQRASGDSKQPRFSAKASERFFFSMIDWVYTTLEKEPSFEPNSKHRDEWLTKVCWKEPHLAGVLNAVVAIDKNRGWTLIGGRNQVNRYQETLHGMQAAPNLTGWRPGMSVSALSYYTTDLGLILEMGREGKNGPMRKMYYTDSTRCNLTGDVDYPLQYDPLDGRRQKWQPMDFLRVVSMPDTREDFNGLGHCAVSRCIELTKMMVAVYEHDREQLGSRAPKGLLLLDGISEQQWVEAMEIREEKKIGLEEEYFAGVAVLAGSGDTAVDGKLLGLSNLPKDFDLQSFTSMLMYGYALCFGYDPSEFYPVQFGALGRGTEMQVQHEKATLKGQMDFAFGFQEQLQLELPETLEFAFDERDDAGELMQSNVASSQAGVIATMGGMAILSDEEIRMLWAEKGLIPYEWTVVDEDVEATDTEDDKESLDAPPDEATAEDADPDETEERKKDRLLSNDYIRRAAETFKSEPIVEYSWPSGVTRTLAESGHWLLKPARRHFIVTREILYENDDVEITDEDIQIAIEVGGERISDEFESLLQGVAAPEDRSIIARLREFLRITHRADETTWYWDADQYRYVTETGTLFSKTRMAGMVNQSIDLSANFTNTLTERLINGDITRAQFSSLLREELKGEYIRQYLLGRGGYAQMSQADWGSIGGSLAEQYRYIDGFIDAILSGDLTAKELASRSRMYSNSSREAYSRARDRTMVAWGADEEGWYTTSGNSCVNCVDYEGEGFMPMGYFPEPCDGTTVCLTNCRCGKVGRNSKTGVEYEG